MVTLSPQPAQRVPVGRFAAARMWAGLGLVLLSVVGVLVLLRAADSSVGVWQVRTDLAAGSTVRVDDLTQAAVRVPDDAAYVSTGTAVQGRVLARDVTAGELLPASALEPSDGAPSRRLVTVPVERFRLPSDLAAGEAVDVYLVVRDATGEPVGQPQLVLASATVDSVDDGGSRFGGDSLQTGVVLAVAPDDAGRLVGASARGDVTLVRVASP